MSAEYAAPEPGALDEPAAPSAEPGLPDDEVVRRVRAGDTALFELVMRRPPLAGVIGPQHFHDYGKLLLAFVMLWTYFSFSQYLIIWSGNLPEEITFYLARTRHASLCPHGRPTVVRIPRDEVARWFGRTGWRRR